MVGVRDHHGQLVPARDVRGAAQNPAAEIGHLAHHQRPDLRGAGPIDSRYTGRNFTSPAAAPVWTK